MNMAADPIRVLCFGDSNTWGRSGSNTDRYPTKERWTGLLQAMLGDEYEVLEEGLRSRTTDLDDDNPNFPGRNGKTYLRPCLESQQPTDVVVLWLGTNDLKSTFNRSPQDVADSLERLVQMILEIGKNANNGQPKIVLASPPIVREEALKPGTQFVGAGEKSKQLAAHVEKVALRTGCSFVDLTLHVQPGDADGVHLDLSAHHTVAELMYKQIITLEGK